MFWDRNPRATQSDGFVTLYKEEAIHPQIAGAFAWANENVFQHLSNKDQRNNTFLAGGALRSYFAGDPLNDFDLYFTNLSVMSEVDSRLGSIGFESVKTGSANAKSHVRRRAMIKGGRVEDFVHNLIYTYYSTPTDVIKSYDFTICMCAITPDFIVYHPSYFTDLALKALRVYHVENPLNSVWRLQKFAKLGYTIDRENLHQLLTEVHNIPALPNIYTEAEQKSDASAVPITDIYGGS